MSAAAATQDTGVTDRPPRRTTVFVGIVAAAALFVLAVGVLGYRAWRRSEPKQVATIVGNDRWTGVQLIVTGDALVYPYESVIERAGRYSVPFFLPPGKYTLVARMGGSEVYRSEFELSERQTQYITLPPQLPSTGPSESQ
jgi:hypothetical protein